MRNRQEILDNLYEAFSGYAQHTPFSCDHCHPKEWQEYFVETNLSEISGDHAYSIVTEVSDHWHNSRVYRHYLPRILELMGKPYFIDTLSPENIFGRLTEMDFMNWSQSEKTVVLQFLEILDNELPFEIAEEREEWEVRYRQFKCT